MRNTMVWEMATEEKNEDSGGGDEKGQRKKEKWGKLHKKEKRPQQ